MGKAVGIDLGTTNSLVAYVEGRGSQVKCLPVDEGSNLLPSAVGYVHGDVVVGRAARRLALEHPRDVIISAMHYHRKSNESWLHEPVPGYDDVTYQRRLKELPTKHQQYIYEMEHSSAATIHDMLCWCYDEPNSFEARYEDLRLDADLSMWRRIVTFLGFDAAERRICEESYWRNSLFGGLSRLGNKHIRSGDVGQWKREFTVPLAYVFLARFPGALQTLGYESDHGWILDLQRRQPATPPSRLGQLANGGLRPLRELSRTFSFF